ncbi:cyclophilin [Platysternon megacephalum]|uniref:Cyclophilin n=1 Tax=Platysternon megacephalum TaxID=55544 RepID=A0A4D9DFJ5_9SAUR|nr:cyclophilin [Platysternon megacephalum]
MCVCVYTQLFKELGLKYFTSLGKNTTGNKLSRESAVKPSHDQDPFVTLGQWALQEDRTVLKTDFSVGWALRGAWSSQNQTCLKGRQLFSSQTLVATEPAPYAPAVAIHQDLMAGENVQCP